MQVGVMGMATDYYADWPERIRAIEDLGFESVFFGDHSHIPVSRRSPTGTVAIDRRCRCRTSTGARWIRSSS